jgi:predicted RNA-binding Zn-ribbon protein involved in translation (DUF1610 family)
MSVNQIAEEMDLSKGMLYGLIRPRRAGIMCPECADEVVYANRTAKERGMLACPQCGWEGAEDEADTHTAGASVVLPATPETVPSPRSSDPGRGRVILAGAILGAAAGLALVFWTKRR